MASGISVAPAFTKCPVTRHPLDVSGRRLNHRDRVGDAIICRITSWRPQSRPLSLGVNRELNRQTTGAQQVHGLRPQPIGLLSSRSAPSHTNPQSRPATWQPCSGQRRLRVMGSACAAAASAGVTIPWAAIAFQHLSSANQRSFRVAVDPNSLWRPQDTSKCCCLRQRQLGCISGVVPTSSGPARHRRLTRSNRR